MKSIDNHEEKVVNPRILVVEDDDILALGINNKLRKLGYEPIGTAATGQQAIDSAGEKIPDLILMDISLKGDMDGIEAAHEIQKNYTIPVIFMTAHSDEKTLSRAKQTVPYGYIVKPIKDQDLIVNIEMTLYKYRYEVILSSVYNSITEGIITMDLNRNITSINNSALEILKLKREDALGKTCHDILNINICEDGSCTFDEALKRKKSVINRNVYHTLDDGNKIPLDINFTLLQKGGNNILGIVMTMRDLSQVYFLQKELSQKYSFNDIISKNHEIQKIFDILPEIAASGSNVLIMGPSGAGKELFARAIHNLGPRKDKPFISINCGALPDNLLESELFGYEAGAFTDAKKSKPGRLASANGGTLFLDEIGEMSQAMQVKLLRVLQNMEYEPLGSVKKLKLDVHLISATNRDLWEMVSAGKFRDDFYYRINIMNLRIPPLAERKEDIPLLVDHFINKFNTIKKKEIKMVSQSVLNFLMNYDFPGNVRELENMIEHAFVLCNGSVIEMQHIPSHLKEASSDFIVDSSSATLEDIVAKVEQQSIKQVMDRNSGNYDKTAKELGISKTTLWRKLKQYDMISK